MSLKTAFNEHLPLVVILALCLSGCGEGPSVAPPTPLDFLIAVGDEVHVTSRHWKDGRLHADMKFMYRRLEDGPLPGKIEPVVRFETGFTYERVDRHRQFLRGRSFHRIDALVEENLGQHFFEYNGTAIDDLKLKVHPYIDLQAPLLPGSAWTFHTEIPPESIEGQGRLMFRLTKRVLDAGLTVAVPGGTFERCLRFTTKGVSEEPREFPCRGELRPRHILREVIVYYCPGVGNVLERTLERSGDPDRPDPLCPVFTTESRLTRVVRAQDREGAPVIPKKE